MRLKSFLTGKMLGFLTFTLSTMLAFLTLTGCSYSINLVHTQGRASDVVDETDTPTTSIVPTISIPSKPI